MAAYGPVGLVEAVRSALWRDYIRRLRALAQSVGTRDGSPAVRGVQHAAVIVGLLPAADAAAADRGAVPVAGFVAAAEVVHQHGALAADEVVVLVGPGGFVARPGVARGGPRRGRLRLRCHKVAQALAERV